MMIYEIGGKNLGRGFSKALVMIICIVCSVTIGAGYAQQHEVGGDITYDAYGSPGRVTFSHETHVNQQQFKCTDCHDKIFKMKMGEASMLQCTTCHDGKKAFSNRDQMGCTHCHK
jgi:c(7)-type cytochrome triheme protein